MPQLRDPTGVYQIGPAFDAECSAPIVTQYGLPVGVYIDDTTPNIAHWISVAVAKYPEGVVIVAVSPGMKGLRYGPRPPVMNAYEAYIFGMGVPWRSWLPIPRYEAYIVQRDYPGTVATKPPGFAKRWMLRRLLRIRRPRLILEF